jgi:hypothetical protein
LGGSVLTTAVGRFHNDGTHKRVALQQVWSEGTIYAWNGDNCEYISSLGDPSLQFCVLGVCFNDLCSGLWNGIICFTEHCVPDGLGTQREPGAAAGINSTMANTGMLVSIIAVFIIVVASLSNSLPAAFATSLVQAGAPSQLLPYFTSLSPTESLFSAFLGYNPVSAIIAALPSGVSSLLTSQTIATLTGLHWFPTTIAGAFMISLHDAFYVSAAFSLVAAVASALRGKESRRRKEEVAKKPEQVVNEVPT